MAPLKEVLPQASIFWVDGWDDADVDDVIQTDAFAEVASQVEFREFENIYFSDFAKGDDSRKDGGFGLEEIADVIFAQIHILG